MRSRDIYACLVRWHPSRFRASFADEMIATFEDASLEQSSGSLIADAIVSLFRQWLFRADNWGHVQRGLPLRDLRRQSDAFHKKAWLVNQGFLYACLILTLNLSVLATPKGLSVSPINVIAAIVLLVFGAIGYPRYKNGCSSIRDEHESMSILSDPRRSDLVRKRVGLHVWGGRSGEEDPVKLLSFYVAISWAGTCVLWHPASGVHWTLLCGAAIAAVSVFTREFNRIAAKALQQEIEAIDDCIRAC
jgi:hypothetical protein